MSLHSTPNMSAPNTTASALIQRGSACPVPATWPAASYDAWMVIAAATSAASRSRRDTYLGSTVQYSTVQAAGTHELGTCLTHPSSHTQWAGWRCCRMIVVLPDDRGATMLLLCPNAMGSACAPSAAAWQPPPHHAAPSLEPILHKDQAPVAVICIGPHVGPTWP